MSEMKFIKNVCENIKAKGKALGKSKNNRAKQNNEVGSADNSGNIDNLENIENIIAVENSDAIESSSTEDSKSEAEAKSIADNTGNTRSKATKNNKKKINLGKTMSIQRKINTMAIAVIAVFTVLIAIILFQMNNYNSKYASVLENISKISYISNNRNTIAKTLPNLCKFGDNIEKTGYNEIVANMEQYMLDITENIGGEELYSQNRWMAEMLAKGVEEYAKNYREIVEVCGGVEFNTKGNELAEQMVASSSFMVTDANNLLKTEITRSEAFQQEIQSSMREMILIIVVLVVVAVVLSTVASLVVSGSITKPLQTVTKRVSIIANGDLTGEDIEVRSLDEVGQLAVSFNKMKSSVSEILKKVLASTDNLKDSMNSVTISMEENTQSSTRIAEAVMEMDEKLKQQQSEVSKIVSQIQEMEAIAEAVVSNADHISANSKETMNNAEKGAVQLEQYIAQMNAINTAIEEVNAIFAGFNENAVKMNHSLKSISDIASQTNLLSLNASIEAARAGDAGRGFAVVADEIRKLADDSQMAAKEIGQMIDTIQSESENMSSKLKESVRQLRQGNELTEETKNNFALIKNGTDEVSESVSEIIAKLKNLSGKINETSNSADVIWSAANASVTDIDEINATVAEESANIESVSQTSTDLLGLTAVLEEEVRNFKLD